MLISQHQPEKVDELDACPCKDEVELEEAQAVFEALQRSQLPETALPHVPGLCPEAGNETITIQIQEEV